MVDGMSAELPEMSQIRKMHRRSKLGELRDGVLRKQHDLETRHANDIGELRQKAANDEHEEVSLLRQMAIDEVNSREELCRTL